MIDLQAPVVQLLIAREMVSAQITVARALGLATPALAFEMMAQAMTMLTGMPDEKARELVLKFLGDHAARSASPPPAEQGGNVIPFCN